MNFGSFLRKREMEKALASQAAAPMAAPGPSAQGNDFIQPAVGGAFDSQYQSYGNTPYDAGSSAAVTEDYYQDSAYYQGDTFDASYNSVGQGAHGGFDVQGRGASRGGPEFGFDGPKRGRPFGQPTGGRGNNRPPRGRGDFKTWQGHQPTRGGRGANWSGNLGHSQEEYNHSDIGAEIYGGSQSFPGEGYEGNEGYYEDYHSYGQNDASYSYETGGYTEAEEYPQETVNQEGGSKQDDKGEAKNPSNQTADSVDISEQDKPSKNKAEEKQDNDGAFSKVDKEKSTPNHLRGVMGTLMAMRETSEEKPEEKQEGGAEATGTKKEETASQAAKKPPLSHKRGVMGTLLAMRETTEDTTEDKQEEDEEESDEDDGEGGVAASHNRGLMGTLICMMGSEAMNRKKEPLPPPRPAKLSQKDNMENVVRQELKAAQEAHEDWGEDEYNDPMDLPAEERDLKPDDIGMKGPSSDFYCKLCKVMTTSANNLQAHLNGKNHRAKLSSVSAGKVLVGTGKGSTKRKIMTLSELGKKSMILEVAKNCQDSLLGLSFMTEYQSVNQVICVCNLCGVKLDINAAISHISGSKHKYQYIKEKKPVEYVHVRKFGGKKNQWVSFLQDLCMGIEQSDGRGTPVIKVFDMAAEKEEPKDPVKEDENDEQKERDNSFFDWVEGEYKKSREAHELKRASSPSNDGDAGGYFDRGYEDVHRRGFRSRFKKTPDPFPPRRGYNDDRRRPPHDFDGPEPAFNRGRPRHFYDDRRGPVHPFDGPDHPDYPPFDPMHGPPMRGRYDHMPYRPPPPPPPSYYRDRPDYLPPPPGREAAPLPPHLDPDPIRRLDALKKARQEMDPLKRVPPRGEPYLDPDPLKRVRCAKPALDPDPLKRILKRDAVVKPMVIDYSHRVGDEGSGPSKKPRNTWEDDIETILGQDRYKKPDGLAMLSNTYSSPERSPPPRAKEDTRPAKKLPFSKSYLDLPENRRKLRKTSRSPAKGASRKSRSSSSSSPSPRRASRSRSRSKSNRPGSSRQSFRKDFSSGRSSLSKRRSRSRSPGLRGRKSRSPVRPGPASSPPHRRSPFTDRKRGVSPFADRKRALSPFSDRKRALSPLADRKRGVSPFSDRKRALSPFADRKRERSPVADKYRGKSPSYGLPKTRPYPSGKVSTAGGRSASPGPSQQKMARKKREEVVVINDSPDEDAQAVDDSEDAQAERIADMLLKMSGSLAQQGDTQATLQALLSNPEVAQTILEAQSKLSTKPQRSEAKPPAAPPSQPSTGRDARDTRVQRQAPTREPVAFSLGSRNTLQQSSAFSAISSDEET